MNAPQMTLGEIPQSVTVAHDVNAVKIILKTDWHCTISQPDVIGKNMNSE